MMKSFPAVHGAGPANGIRGERGFVALAAVLVICTALTLTVLPSSLRGHLAHLNAADAELSAASRQLALACLELTALRLRQDSATMGPMIVDQAAVPSLGCFVDSIALAAGGHEVRVSAEAPPRRSIRIWARWRALILDDGHVISGATDLGTCDARDPPQVGCE